MKNRTRPIWVLRQSGDIAYINRPRILAIFDAWIRQPGEPIFNLQITKA